MAPPVSTVPMSSSGTPALAVGQPSERVRGLVDDPAAKNIVAAAAGANIVAVTSPRQRYSRTSRVLEYKAPTPTAVGRNGRQQRQQVLPAAAAATIANATDLIFRSQPGSDHNHRPRRQLTSRLLTSPDADIAEDGRCHPGSSQCHRAAPVPWWIMQMVAFTPTGGGTLDPVTSVSPSGSGSTAGRDNRPS